MKLYEIANTPLTSVEQVKDWIRKYVEGGAYDIINGVLWVDESNIEIFSADIIPIKGFDGDTFPVKFEAGLTFTITDCPNLSSLNGIPERVRSLMLENCPKLSSLKNLPKIFTGTLSLFETGITSLVGIHEHIKELYGIALNAGDIREGGLGLLQIPKLQFIFGGDEADEPFKIIRKYIQKPDDIFECQAELIDQGFEEYAKL